MTLLDRSDLRALGVKFSRPHLWRLVRDGKFPKPVKLGERRIAWVQSEIEAHLQNMIAKRDAQG